MGSEDVVEGEGGGFVDQGFFLFGDIGVPLKEVVDDCEFERVRDDDEGLRVVGRGYPNMCLPELEQNICFLLDEPWLAGNTGLN